MSSLKADSFDLKVVIPGASKCLDKVIFDSDITLDRLLARIAWIEATGFLPKIKDCRIYLKDDSNNEIAVTRLKAFPYSSTDGEQGMAIDLQIVLGAFGASDEAEALIDELDDRGLSRVPDYSCKQYLGWAKNCQKCLNKFFGLQ